MPPTTSETFIIPEPVERQPQTIPASLFNQCRRLMNRFGNPHVFVPIRSMQFQAIIDAGEIHFVDNQGGYAIEQGVGGRMVSLSWDLTPARDRQSLTGPVAICLHGYDHDMHELNRRILSEFPAALDTFEKRNTPEAEPGRVATFRMRSTS